MKYYSVIRTLYKRYKIEVCKNKITAVNSCRILAQIRHHVTGYTVFYDVWDDNGRYIESGQVYGGHTYVDRSVKGQIYANAMEMDKIRRVVGVRK